jgi:broad specificity phosphatase PhoE
MKKIYFIRHSISEMNEHLKVEGNQWGIPGFIEAGLYDTKLSEAGLALVKKLNSNLRSGAVAEAKGIETAELLLVSPLTRTMQTAHMGLEGVLREDIKKIVCPLASERLYLSSDCGKSRKELEIEYPHYDYSMLGEDEEDWWYTVPEDDYEEWRPDGAYKCPGEPRADFEARILKFKRFLESRQEQNIVVVAHWGVIKAISGESLDNCEVIQLSPLEFLDELDKNC